MDFAESVSDFGDVPIVSVDGIAAIEKISAHKIRVSYFVESRSEKRLILHVDWDEAVWRFALDDVRARFGEEIRIRAAGGN